MYGQTDLADQSSASVKMLFHSFIYFLHSMFIKIKSALHCKPHIKNECLYNTVMMNKHFYLERYEHMATHKCGNLLILNNGINLVPLWQITQKKS